MRDKVIVITGASGGIGAAVARRVAAHGTLVSVHGGRAPMSDPCEPFSAHGFFGVEAPAVDAIVLWMRGEVPPKDVP